MRAIIVDDEVLARQRIKILLREIEGIEVVKECSNGKEAITHINQLRPDLIFLDIQIKDMTGFDVLQHIEIKPLIIFVTAHDEFALKAFDFFPFDYLLKPYKDDRFFVSVEKALKTQMDKRASDFDKKLNYISNFLKDPELIFKKFSSERLSIKTGNKISFVDKSNIKYIKASGYYAEIFTEQKKYLIRESLSNLIDKLNAAKFIRIHRSTIINMSYMEELKHSNYNEIDVKMSDGNLFRVSKSYKKEFQRKIGVTNG